MTNDLSGEIVITERRIVGDPLVFTPPRLPELPETKLMKVIRDLPRHHHPNDRTVWPHVPDPEPVLMSNLRPGYVAWVTTNFGIRQYLVRTVNRSTWRRNSGRHFMVGMDRQGWCHSVWVHDQPDPT